MPKVEADTFLDLVERSGLAEKSQLAEFRTALEASSGDETPLDCRSLAIKLVAAGIITRWQAEKLCEGRHKGFFLAKYKLLDHLGTGGMSSVYLAQHVLMGHRVAIKVLPTHRLEDSSYLARFHREARAVVSLDHPNIVRASDADSEGKVHYLVMEYVPGRNLMDLVKDEGPLKYEVAADFIAQAAEGLQHAHETGLVHRDIKPANLLVNPKGVVKILDFGLAYFAADSQTSLTIAYDENVLGTADFLAPEQAIQSHGVDGRADIYSLGCTLYFLLTGHPPFPDGTLAKRLMMHQMQEPASILVDRHKTPPELLAICQKMMAKKKENRYQSAADVAQALREWLARAAPGALPEDVRASSSSIVRKRPAVTQPGSGVPAENAPSGQTGDTVRNLDRPTLKSSPSTPGTAASQSGKGSGVSRGAGASEQPREGSSVFSKPSLRPAGEKGNANPATSGGAAKGSAASGSAAGGSKAKIAPAAGHSGIRPQSTGAPSNAGTKSGSGTKLPPQRPDDEEYGLLELGDAVAQQKKSPSEVKAAPEKKGPAPQVSLTTSGPSPYDQITRAAEIDIKAPGPTLLPIEEKEKPANLLPLYLTLGAVGVVIVVIAVLVMLS